jgi:hypothetical protein
MCKSIDEDLAQQRLRLVICDHICWLMDHREAHNYSESERKDYKAFIQSDVGFRYRNTLKRRVL